MKYRNKPVIVEAFRLGYDHIPDWFMEKVNANQAHLHTYEQGVTYANVDTTRGWCVASPGDYITMSSIGEVNVYKSHVFMRLYEKVEESV